MSTALQDAAVARKEKLAALKKRKTLHDSGAPTELAPDSVTNYDPETGAARKHARKDEEETVEKIVEGLADKAIAEDEARRKEELLLTNIQPKKPNWDLKRDLDRKLSKLKPKTDQAIFQLIRKRLQAEKGGEAAAAGLVIGNIIRPDAEDSDEEDLK